MQAQAAVSHKLNLSPSLLKWLAPLVALMILLGGFFGFQVWRQSLQPRPAALLEGQAIENKYGIRFTRIAMTAAGGMVDIRYMVTDTSKVLDMVSDVKNMPVVITKNGHRVGVNTQAVHKHGYELGRSYWLLYYNTANYLRTGDSVTIKVGNLELKNVLVE